MVVSGIGTGMSVWYMARTDVVGLRRLEKKLGSCEGAVAVSGRRVSNTRSVSELG